MLSHAAAAAAPAVDGLKAEPMGVDTDTSDASPPPRVVPDVEQTLVQRTAATAAPPAPAPTPSSTAPKRFMDTMPPSFVKRVKLSQGTRRERVSLASKLAVLQTATKRPLVRPVVEGELRRFSEELGDALLIEYQTNGGASVVHVFPEVMRDLNATQRRLFVDVCYDVIFRETAAGDAEHCFGVIHGGASDVQNVLRMIGQLYPKTPVVKYIFGQTRLTETLTISKYVEQAERTLEFNTHRAGQMQAMSLVGCQKQEETGGYFEEVIDVLEANSFLQDVLPWGCLSRYDELSPADSDDGPIMWACPGEQVVPLAELAAAEKGLSTDGTPNKRKRTDIERLQMRPRNEKPREKLVPDRTGAHADMAGLFPERHPVAAVGFVQGLAGDRYDLKDIVAFHAGDMDRVADLCGLYFQEEPKDQLIDKEFWVNEAKLNHLRRSGVRYAHIRLKADDIYFIPRKVVHQFKTVSACISVTWHLKHFSYYLTPPAPEDVAAVPSLPPSGASSLKKEQDSRPASPAPARARKAPSASSSRRRKADDASWPRRRKEAAGKKRSRAHGKAPRKAKTSAAPSPSATPSASRKASPKPSKLSTSSTDVARTPPVIIRLGPASLKADIKKTAPAPARRHHQHHKKARDDGSDSDASDSSCSTCSSGSASDAGSYSSYTGSSYDSYSSSSDSDAEDAKKPVAKPAAPVAKP